MKTISRRRPLSRIPFLLCAAGLATVAGADGPTARHELQTLDGPVIAERVLDGIVEPVAIEFLPDGRALVLQRKAGIVTLADFTTGEKTDLTGLPDLHVDDAAGVHDVQLHPEYADNGWIYLSYSEGRPEYSTVVLDRIRLDGTRMKERERLFAADAFSEGRYHFAARIAVQDGYVFLTIGDREHPSRSQDRGNHAGTVVRLHDDGRVPADNPFVDAGEADGVTPRPEIWNYGHRDPQGLFVHPETGELWLHDHGPRGGDELNLLKPGANYGWPEISFGFEYEGGPIGMGLPMKEGMEVPFWVYVPSIAPSDLLVYQGDAFPAWRGNFLLGAMAGVHLNRLVLRDGEIVAEERIGKYVMGRIRSLAVDRAGLIYLGSDNGEVWRLRPGD
jgi:glucose/arabinose dehydrogenase